MVSCWCHLHHKGHIGHLQQQGGLPPVQRGGGGKQRREVPDVAEEVFVGPTLGLVGRRPHLDEGGAAIRLILLWSR